MINGQKDGTINHGNLCLTAALANLTQVLSARPRRARPRPYAVLFTVPPISRTAKRPASTVYLKLRPRLNLKQ